MLVSQNAVIIRVPVSGIAHIGRVTQGVRVMRMKEGDKVITVARVDSNGK